MRQTGLAPVYDSSVRLLIVGTFPSQKSLAQKQYYANPQNNFWRIMGGVLQVALVEMNYTQRTAILLKAGIGLWDAIESCQRDGSMDHKILDPRFNDFQTLSIRCPKLRAVACNGKLASKSVEGKMPRACITLASSSPANTGMPLAKKTELWRAALRPFL